MAGRDVSVFIYLTFVNIYLLFSTDDAVLVPVVVGLGQYLAVGPPQGLFGERTESLLGQDGLPGGGTHDVSAGRGGGRGRDSERGEERG